MKCKQYGIIQMYTMCRKCQEGWLSSNANTANTDDIGSLQQVQEGQDEIKGQSTRL